MADLDVVGGAAVDVVPIIPQFHNKLKALVLPIADRVGEDAGRRMGQAISNNIVIAIPDAIRTGGRAGVVAAGRSGDDAGGAFSRSLKRKLEVAFRSMPKLQVGLRDTGVDAELARLRSKLEQLSGKRIGIDVDATAARAEVERIERELERLGAQHPNVQVRADTAAARAALIAIREEIDSIDRKDIRVPVRVDTSQATSALMSLGLQIAALTAIPLGPTLAAGLGAVVTMAAAAGAGVGALALAAIPAVKSVTEVIRLKSAAEDEATNATNRGAASASQAASRAIQLAGVQAQLASAHRNAAKTIEAAERAVAQAQRSVADAVEQAAERRKTAADGVRRAEQSLTDAQRAARQAEQSLTQARANAAQQLKALNDQLTDGALDQREATLRVQQAQEDLNAVMADPTATRLQQEAAQLALDRAKQGAKEQAQNYADLKKSAEAQRKAGVDGSDAVKAATERVGDAQRTVADQTEALAKAHEAAAKAQRDGARSVADAQAKVADAVRASADAQVSAAESVASAQRSVDSARLTSARATTGAISKEEEYQRALAKLSPVARGLFSAVAGPSGLTAAFKAWSQELQPDVLPLFTRGVDGMKDSLPGLTPLAKGAAAGIDSLMDSASAELKTPFWASFKDDLDTSVKPAVVGFGKTFGNVIKGVAGVIDAFLPHMDGIAKKSDSITGRFAKWGLSLKGSPTFERFLQYVKDTAPGLASFIGDVLAAALDVSKAVAPLSTTMIAVVGPVFSAISSLATNNPGLVQALWGLWAAQKAIALGMVAFSAAMAVYQSVMLLSAIATAGFGTVLSATGILPIIRAVLIVVGLLVAGFVLAYNNCEWFRKAIDGAWEGIKIASQFVWDNVLKPIFDALWTVIKNVGDIAVWLWKNAIVPAFNGIMAIVKPVAKVLLTIFLIPAYVAFKLLGAVIKWLWREVVSPVFTWIGDKAKALYEKHIKPHTGDAKKAFEILGRAVKTLWDTAFKPVLGWIGDKMKWLYDKAIKPYTKDIRRAVDLMALGFKTAKDSIKKEWDQLREITKKPVKFIISHVYNGGIVPLWNKVADITGADKLKKMDLKGFHTGGIMSGYSPGRDDRVIAVGGGEAVMRPEWTRAVGADQINAWNAAARSGGISGVQRAISSGMPAFADGGIVGWFKDRGNDVGKFVNGAKNAAADALGFLDPSKLFDKATGYIRGQLDGIATNGWAKSVVRLPIKMLSALKDKAMGIFGGGGDGSGNVSSALSWARTQAGKAYQWGGNGDPSWDCSGFMSAIESVIRGEKPHRRWATGSFNGAAAPSGWVRGLRAPFMIGVTNAGVGHTAGTLAGVNVESRGGDGVVVGSRARSYHDPMFRDVYGFRPSIGGGSGGSVAAAQSAARQMLGEFGWGDSQWSPLKKLWQGESGWRWNASNPSSGAYGIPQSLPGSKMASAGADWRTNPSTQIKWGLGYIKNRPDCGSPAAAYSKWLSRSPHWYDDGGYLPEGLSLVANGTGRPEPVFTGSQWDTLRANAGRGGSQPPNITVENHVWVGNREITDIVDHRIEVHDADTGRALAAGRYI